MITTAVVALVASGLIFVLVIKLSSSPDAKNNLGDPTFQLGEATDMATEVSQRGPLLFQAPQGGGTRDIYVNHLGSDPKTGWVAFQAYAKERRCSLLPRGRGFVDPCTKHAYGPDPGADFTHFKVTVESNGRLEVDFRATLTTSTTTL